MKAKPKADIVGTEPTQIDTVASNSCTRSGAFALLVSLALTSSIPYWLQARKDAVLGRYLALRLNLSVEVDALSESVNWQIYKKAHNEAESMSLAQLLAANAESPQHPATTIKNRRRESKLPAQTGASMPLLPPAPTNIRVMAPISEIHEIARFLTELDDTDLLATSRQASNDSDGSIYRWLRKRNALISKNLGSTVVHIQSDSALKSEGQKAGPSAGKELLLGSLTLRDAKELAQFELPKIPDRFQGNVSKGFEISISSLPSNLLMASLFAPGLLLFLIMYFGAFAREAVSSAHFPVSGTLFGAFSRSYWTRLVFVVAVWSPFLASAVVGIVSRE